MVKTIRDWLKWQWVRWQMWQDARAKDRQRRACPFFNALGDACRRQECKVCGTGELVA